MDDCISDCCGSIPLCHLVKGMFACVLNASVAVMAALWNGLLNTYWMQFLVAAPFVAKRVIPLTTTLHAPSKDQPSISDPNLDDTSSANARTGTNLWILQHLQNS